MSAEYFDNGVDSIYVTSGYHSIPQQKAIKDSVEFKSDQEIYDGDEHAAVEITLSGKHYLSINEESRLTITPSPVIANVPEVIWESSDSSILEVQNDGLLVGKNIGQATITATSTSGIIATLDITVCENGNEAQKEENEETIVNELTEKGGGEVVITEGEVGTISIPSSVTKTSKITAPLSSDATVEASGSKLVYVNNTSTSPSNLTVDAPSVSTVYLTGLYNNVNTNTSIKVSEGEVSDININGEVGKNVTVNGVFSESSNVNSETNKNVTISNGNTNEPSLNINTPNSTVTLNSSWNVVESTVGDNTLNVGPAAHIKKLIVKKGNVVVKDTKVENRIDEVVNDTEYTVSPNIMNASTWSQFKSYALQPGITNLDANINATATLTFGLFASGNYEWNLGEHNIEFSGAKNGMFFVRGSALNLTIKGTGEYTNSDYYGLWLSNKSSVVNVMGGKWTASTHAIYCENGQINIYGGEFKLTGEEKKYLLNCYDSSYTAGTANITVYGGKYYGFDPANSMSEVGGPVSFVADGYKSVEVEEGVFEVMPV